METILAAYPLAVESGFQTPEEAIAFSQWMNVARGNEVLASCQARVIRAASWCDDAIFLQLDDGKALRLGCTGYVVDLTVEDASVGASTLRGPDAVFVRLEDEMFYWNRGELIRALEGNSIHRIQAGQTIYFLYVTNVGIVMISVLINRSTACPFLYWELTD